MVDLGGFCYGPTMSTPPASSKSGLTALVVLQVIASLGTTAWWVYWFASGSNTHGAPCDLVYENSFPVGDMVMAGSVMATAVQVHRRKPSALFLGFAAAGMSLDLAFLDTAHNLFTGAFHAPIGTIVQKAVFAVVNAAVGVGTLVLLNRDREDFPWSGSGGASPLAAGLSGSAAVFGIGLTGLYIVLAGSRPECAHQVEVPFAAPLLLLSGLGLAGAVLRARPLALAAGGSLIHAGLVGVFYALGHADIVPVALLIAAVVGATLGVAILTASRESPPAA